MNEELRIIISAELENLKKELEKGKKELKNFEQSGDSTGKKFGKAMAGAGKATSAAMKAIGAAVAAGAAALVGLAEGTREYRTEQAKLVSAFETAGSSAEQAKETYNDLYRVLGDSGQATEAANHLAKLTTNQEDLAEWTKICQGAYATFGDSMPIESLTEAANETAKTGEITGALADALNWAGVSEDEFAEQLFWCNSEAEREALIRSTLTGLYGEAANSYEENAAAILAANEAQAALTESLAALGAATEPVVTIFKAEFASALNDLVPSINLVSEGLQGMMSGVEGSSDKLSQGISDMLLTIVDKIVGILPGLLTVGVQVISALIEGIIIALPDLINAVIEIIPKIIEALVTLIPQLTGAILGMLPMIIEAIFEIAAGILEGLAVILPQILEQIVNMLPSIINAIVEGIPLLLNAAITLFMAIVEAIPKIIPPLIDALPEIIDNILNMLLENLPVLLDASVTLFMALVDAIPIVLESLVEALPDIIVSIITTIIQAIPMLLANSVQMFMAIVEAIPKIIPPLVKALPQIVTAVIVGLGQELGKVFGNIWNEMVNIFKGAGRWFGNIFKGAANSIKNAFSGVTNFFSGIWNSIKNIFSKIGSTIGSAITNAVKTAINGVLSTAVKIINGFISAINIAISVINAIPGVDIKKLDKLNVPKLEHGGVLKKGQIGLLEGSGAEAVVPLEKNTEWLDKIATMLSNKLGGTGNAPIVLQVDGKTFAKTAISTINSLTRQQGKLSLNLV